jgi:hypothetical protein
MCVNAETSITAFVVGSFFNFLVAKSTSNVNYLMVAGIYQFTILMQLFDFIAWKDQQCTGPNNIGTRFAFIFNILHPVIIILILLLFTQVKNIKHKIIIVCLMFLYISFITYNLYYSSGDPIECLKPTDTCKNLYYKWWDKTGNYTIFAYLIPIIMSFLLLLKSFTFSIIHIVYIIISLLASTKYYSCGKASTWCLFATGGPLLNYLLLKSNIV